MGRIFSIMDTSPSITNQIKDLSEIAKDSVKNILSGKSAIADDNVISFRLNLCEACEFYVKDQSRCKKCGCFMKAKTKMFVAKCPINKW